MICLEVRMKGDDVTTGVAVGVRWWWFSGFQGVAGVSIAADGVER
jgi:hypothetical protein